MREFFNIFRWSSIGFIFPILLLPFQISFYEPHSFGVLAILLAISGILAPLFSGRLEQALVLCNGPTDRVNVLLACSAISVASTFLLLLATLAAVMLGRSQALFSATVISLPFFSLCGTINIVTERAFIIYGMNEWVGKQQLLRNLLTGAIPLLALVAFEPTSDTLVASTIIAMLITSGVSLHKIRVAFLHELSGHTAVTLPSILRTIQRYRRMTFLGLPHSLLNSAGNMFPPIFLGSMLSPTEVGFYSVACRLVLSPVSILNQAFGALNSVKIASHKQNGKHRSLPLITLAISCIYTIAFSVGIFIVDQSLLPLGLEEWSHLTLYCVCLLPLMFGMLTAAPLYYVPIVYKKQSFALFLEASSLTLRVVGLGVGVTFFNGAAALLFFSGSTLLVSGITWLWYNSLMRGTSNNE